MNRGLRRRRREQLSLRATSRKRVCGGGAALSARGAGVDGKPMSSRGIGGAAFGGLARVEYRDVQRLDAGALASERNVVVGRPRERLDRCGAGAVAQEAHSTGDDDDTLARAVARRPPRPLIEAALDRDLTTAAEV